MKKVESEEEKEACVEDDASFWAAAYFAPLHLTLRRWHERIPATRRFTYVMDHWWPILLDGLQPTSTRLRPICIAPYDENDWFIQRLILLYMCHVPYMEHKPPPPTSLQPFRPILDAYSRCMSSHGPMSAWIERDGLPKERDAWNSVLDLLRNDPACLREVRPYTWRGHAWPAHKYMDHALDAYELSRALSLMRERRLGVKAMSIHQVHWLYEYVCTWRAQLPQRTMRPLMLSYQRDSVCTMEDACHMAQQSMRVAYEWIVYSALAAAPSESMYMLQRMWEQLGECLAYMPQPARVANVLVSLTHATEYVRGDLACFLEQTAVMSSPCRVLADIRIAWLVRFVCIPRFLGILSERVDSGTCSDTDAKFFCTFALRFVDEVTDPNVRGADAVVRAASSSGVNDDDANLDHMPFTYDLALRVIEPTNDGAGTVEAAPAALAAFRRTFENLEPLFIVLRRAALQMSKHTYGAELYRTLSMHMTEI